MDTQLFDQNNIRLAIQEWKCLEYHQQYSEKDGFITNLSIIDLLMNYPNHEVLSYLTIKS